MIDNISVNDNNSIRIEDETAGVIYIDPYGIKGETHDASFVLVTHEHYDHYSPEDILKVAGDDTVLIVPEKMEGKTKGIAGKMKSVSTVKPGAFYEIEGLGFDTVPSYNIMKPFHTKGAGWVGYILHLSGKLIYIAGDTDATNEAKAVKCDIALVPIGGTYTMDAKQAAELINLIKPEYAIPVHYGSVAGSPAAGDRFAELVNAPVSVVKKLSF